MRFLLKFSLLLTLIIVITSMDLTYDQQIVFPRDAGPALDNKVRTNYLKYIDENQPQLVLLGDSTLGAGVDANALAQQTGKTVYSISIPGSASALWYLILKSNIAHTTYKPGYVVIVFRNTLLTAPGYRVHGSYFDQVDEYAARHEPLLIENSFVRFMNPLEIAAERYFPLYVARAEIRKGIDSHIRYLTPALLGCNEGCNDQALGEIFAGADLEPKALVDAVDAAESYLYTPDQLDFGTQVAHSYLPEMIRIAQARHIKLVFVRVKVRMHGGDPKVEAYIDALANYLDQNHVPLLDFGNDERLTDDLFLDSIHLNSKGQPVFTRMVADGLNGLFAEK